MHTTATNVSEMKCSKSQQSNSYRETKMGRTLFRITSEYKGDIDLTKTLEDLLVKKILAEENAD